MKIIDKIIDSLFGEKKKDDNLSTTEYVIEEGDNLLHRSQNYRRQPLQPLYTFYRIGPSFITYNYPVENSSAEEIIKQDGIIGPHKYQQDKEFLHNIEEWENEELQAGNPALLEQLRTDLLFLATEHKMYGAYTLLGSLAPNREDGFIYFKQAAELGVKEGMVTYGLELLTNGETELGRTWLEKGAELGDHIGMIDIAISYQYGTFTPINYDKAAYFYKRLIKEHNKLFAYNNLGVMYVMANYFHTALHLFEQINDIILQDKEQAETFYKFGERDLLKNAESCKQLLRLPIEERIKRAVEQYHSPQLDKIFCNDFISPSTIVPEQKAKTQRWLPTIDDEYIVEADKHEHQFIDTQSLVPTTTEVKYPFDDFIFPTYNVRIMDSRIFGSQHEMIFLEKNVHYELNLYIQQHLGQLRHDFRTKNYDFVYLPAHSFDINDIVATYSTEYESPNQLAESWTSREHKIEQNYWKAFISDEQLPDDCAGFLHYKPNVENKDEHSHYEYILFPINAGTNWEKAFSYLLQYIGSQPFVKMVRKRSLPQDTILLVDTEYNIFLIDNTGNKLTDNIKMPILSKVLYFTLLRHPDGIAIKYMSDYKDELLRWYDILSNRKKTHDSIERLIDPTDNSANEKISRIRNAFEQALQEYEDTPDEFIPIGKKSQPYVISLARTRILWQPTEMTIFENDKLPT